jgi:hypothetical protein
MLTLLDDKGIGAAVGAVTFSDTPQGLQKSLPLPRAGEAGASSRGVRVSRTAVWLVKPFTRRALARPATSPAQRER